MNHVTFETAKRLEAAGFPKPETVQPGTLWFNYNGFAFFISLADYKDSTGVEYITGISVYDGKTGASFHPAQTRLSCTFAPTATDILKELGDNFAILYDNELSEYWMLKYTDVYVWDAITESAFENPAEAAAMAWLQIHEK